MLIIRDKLLLLNHLHTWPAELSFFDKYLVIGCRKGDRELR